MSEKNETLKDKLPALQDLLMRQALLSHAIENTLIETQGEISPATEKWFDELDLLKEMSAEKVDACHFVRERLKKASDTYYDQAEFFLKIAKGLAAAEDRLKQNIKNAMALGGLDVIEGKNFTYKLVDSTPSLKVDESRLPKEFFQEVIEFIVDKQKIKDHLANHQPVPGAELITSKALRMVATKK